MICPNCGASNSTRATFCRRCHQRLPVAGLAAGVTYPRRRAASTGGGRLPIIAALALALTGLIVGAMLVAFARPGGGQNVATATGTPESSLPVFVQTTPTPDLTPTPTAAPPESFPPLPTPFPSDTPFLTPIPTDSLLPGSPTPTPSTTPTATPTHKPTPTPTKKPTPNTDPDANTDPDPHANPRSVRNSNRSRNGLRRDRIPADADHQ